MYSGKLPRYDKIFLVLYGIEIVTACILGVPFVIDDLSKKGNIEILILFLVYAIIIYFLGTFNFLRIGNARLKANMIYAIVTTVICIIFFEFAWFSLLYYVFVVEGIIYYKGIVFKN